MFHKAAIEKEEFGLDLPSAQRHQQNHHVQHDAVLAFQDELNKIKELEVRFVVYREITVKCCDFVIEGNLSNDSLHFKVIKN